MVELLTAAQMRAIEAAAIASGRVTGLELMERAGQGVIEAIFAEWPAMRASPGRALVLCGPGNNGGDGFVVARLLQGWGWEVRVYLYGDADRLPPDARVNYERWCEMGEVIPYAERGRGERHDLLVDALFGTGLKRPLVDLSPQFFGWFEAVTENDLASGEGPAIVSIDLPSGICADSGRVLEPDAETYSDAAYSHLTVTFHAPKRGHYLADGPRHTRKLVVVDIGLAKPRGPAAVELAEPRREIGKWPWNHKYHHGHALVLSGGVGRGGAARLAARGALRVGAGLVTVACPPAALIENAARLDAIMLRPLKGETEAGALEAMLADARISALCLGPGLGVERAAALLPVALAAKRRTVLDADALTALAADPGLVALLHEDCVLTPHGGEFARLFPDLSAGLTMCAPTGPAWSKIDATRAAAARVGCIVLLKGADTVIARPDEPRVAVQAAAYDRAAPWLATAGSGDVLAGIITGLMAWGLVPYQAAETGAWLHVEAARSFGPGLIAEDLPEQLPAVFRALGL